MDYLTLFGEGKTTIVLEVLNLDLFLWLTSKLLLLGLFVDRMKSGQLKNFLDPPSWKSNII